MVDSVLGASPPSEEGGLAHEISRALTVAAVLGDESPSIERYRVKSKLGQGGMSTVFACEDPKLGRLVAIKVLQAKALDTTDLEVEARALAKLAHPNVVTVFDVGESRGQVFVAMELVDGGDAAQALLADPAPSLTDIVAWFLDAARGLEAAHQAGIIHRDFKLENLLIGRDGRARVTDFGLARTDEVEPAPLSASSSSSASASWHSIVGTPGYMAPELLQGHGASVASDEYAFFIALDRALRVRGEHPPRRLREMIERGTSSVPSERFNDMASVRRQLADLLERPARKDQRSRQLLVRRVRKAWIDGVRGPSLKAVGYAIELPVSRAAEFVPEGSTKLELLGDECDAGSLALAMGEYGAAILLIGSPGSGKTLRLVEVAESMIEHAGFDASIPLPVLLNLSSFSDAEDFGEWLLDEVVARYALPRAQIQDWIESGSVCLLLDGLDELAAQRRSACVEALNVFRKTHPLPVLLSCREDEYRELHARLVVDTALRIEPATATQVRAATAAHVREGEPKVIDHELVEHLRNPLLLSMYLDLQPQLEESELPLREQLYKAAVRRALGEGPEAEERLEGLLWLANALRRTGRTEIWLESMQMDWLATRAQRIFAMGLALVLVFGGAFALNIWGARISGQGLATGIVWGAASAISAFVINRGLRLVPMEAMGWSWPRFWKWIPFNVGMGVVAGAAHGYYSNSWVDILVGAATGLLGMAMIGLAPAGRERRMYPGAGLVESVRNATIVAPIIGLILFAGIAYVTVPAVTPFSAPGSMYRSTENAGFVWGLTMGFSGGYATWIATGMWAPIAHACLRLMLTLSSPLPWKLRPWFDDLVRRDLLRSVGGGWMFRHHTIREWLADQSLDGLRD